MRALPFLVLSALGASTFLALACGDDTGAISGVPEGGGSSTNDQPFDATAAEGSTDPTKDAGADLDAAQRKDADASASPDGGACAHDCNQGTCFEGVCICDPLAYIQTDGTCGATAPGDCAAQGGTCHSMPAECPDGQQNGLSATDHSCGDLVAAVCCMTCDGPHDFVCCTPTDEGPIVSPPICTYTFETCPSGATAVAGSIDDPNVCGR